MNEIENKNHRLRLLVLFVCLLIIGILIGSIYLVKLNVEMMNSIKNYITNFFGSIAENKNSFLILKNSLKSNLILTAIIFVMGFFRFGFLAVGLVVVRQGFVMGFTTATFLKLYGGRGMLVMLSTIPTIVITVPALLIFSTVSVSFAMNREKKSKKIIFSYIFFLILTIAIFCVASFFEGYLTTTFMKILSPNMV